jgi:hypothetical protein
MHQCKNIEELIDVVKKCWVDFPLDTCKKVWTSLQLVLDVSFKARGVNDYKLPHMSKDKYIWEHCEIPLRLPCTALAAAANPTAPIAPSSSRDACRDCQWRISNYSRNRSSPASPTRTHHSFPSSSCGGRH